MVRPRRERQDRGSTMVEASLTLTLFLIFVMSLFDFGYSVFLQQSLVHQARTGARYGATNPDDLTAIKNMVLYNRTTGSGTGYLGLAPNSVAVARAGSPAGPDDRIVVTISGYVFTWITPGFAGKKTAKPIVITSPVEN
jgi:hypothetical protein